MALILKNKSKAKKVEELVFDLKIERYICTSKR